MASSTGTIIEYFKSGTVIANDLQMASSFAVAVYAVHSMYNYTNNIKSPNNMILVVSFMGIVAAYALWLSNPDESLESLEARPTEKQSPDSARKLSKGGNVPHARRSQEKYVSSPLEHAGSTREASDAITQHLNHRNTRASVVNDLGVAPARVGLEGMKHEMAGEEPSEFDKSSYGSRSKSDMRTNMPNAYDFNRYEAKETHEEMDEIFADRIMDASGELGSMKPPPAMSAHRVGNAHGGNVKVDMESSAPNAREAPLHVITDDTGGEPDTADGLDSTSLDDTFAVTSAQDDMKQSDIDKLLRMAAANNGSS